MTTTEMALADPRETVPATHTFGDAGAFELAQRMAKALAASELVPQQFRGEKGLPNTLIAIELAQRTGASPLAVMQSLYIVQGKPTWSAQFIIGCLNSCGRFGQLRYSIDGQGDSLSCYAWAIDLSTNERLEGPRVTMAMAKAEGWLSKAGSKWQTMPDLMIRYRAATFFGRLYAPDLLLGMQTVEEVRDIDVDVRTGEVTAVRGVLGLKRRLGGAVDE